MKVCLAIVLVLCSLSAAKAQTVIADVAYGNLPGQKLDVYPSARPNSPIVVLIHGGAWYGGVKSDLADLAEFLRKRDYTVASIDYRVSWQATFPANIQDVSCALAYLKRNAATYHADPSHVALLGYSAGGHLAMLQATAGTKYLECDDLPDLNIDGMIGVCGIYTFEHRVPGDPDRLLQMLADSARYWNEAQPIHHFDGVRDTKYLLITDAMDPIVSEKNSYDLFDSLASRGHDVMLLTVFQKDHINILSTISEEDTVIHAITSFLDSLWPRKAAVLDTVDFDVDMQFEGRQVDVFSKHDGRILIYDLLGRSVAQYEVERGTSHHYLWNVPYGCYFVSVIANNRRTTVRVILE